MKLVIELTNGKQDACGDCEMVNEMLIGYSKEYLKKNFDHDIPDYWFEE